MNAESNTFQTTVEWEAPKTATSRFLAALPRPTALPANSGELLIFLQQQKQASTQLQENLRILIYEQTLRFLMSSHFLAFCQYPGNTPLKHIHDGVRQGIWR